MHSLTRLRRALNSDLSKSSIFVVRCPVTCLSRFGSSLVVNSAVVQMNSNSEEITRWLCGHRRQPRTELVRPIGKVQRAGDRNRSHRGEDEGHRRQGAGALVKKAHKRGGYRAAEEAEEKAPRIHAQA